MSENPSNSTNDPEYIRLLQYWNNRSERLSAELEKEKELSDRLAEALKKIAACGCDGEINTDTRETILAQQALTLYTAVRRKNG